MATTTRSIEVTRWIGRIDDVVQLAQAMARHVTDDVRIEINEEHRDQAREHQFANATELDERRNEVTVSAVRSMRIHAVGTNHAWAEFREGLQGAARLYVEGSDDAWVDGAFEGLRRQLVKCQRRPRKVKSFTGSIAIIVVAGVVALALAGTAWWWHSWWLPGLGAVVFVVGILASAGLIGLLPGFPLFALVEPGYESRLERLQKQVPAIIKAVLWLLAGALIGRYVGK